MVALYFACGNILLQGLNWFWYARREIYSLCYLSLTLGQAVHHAEGIQEEDVCIGNEAPDYKDGVMRLILSRSIQGGGK